MRILITSSYYWPELSGNSPYVTGMAEHFVESGHDVTVIAAFPHYPQWKPQRRQRFAQTEHRGGVEIRRRFHYVPSEQSALRRAAYEGSLLVGGATALRLPERPDAIIGIVPTLAGGLHAAMAAKAYRMPYSIVFHDLMGQGARQSGISGGGGRVADVVARVEMGLANGAERIAVYAEGMREYFLEQGFDGGRIDRVRPWTLSWNPTETAEEARERLGWPRDQLVCVHAGNMGLKQGLENVLDAAAGLRDDPSVRIVLAGHGNDRPHLEERAKELSLSNVEFVDPQPWGKYEGLLMAADVLIVNQRATVGEMCFPSKLTSYFPAGRPILAAVASDGDTAAEVRASEAGLLVTPDDPQALVEAIREIAGRDDRGAALGEAGRRYAEKALSPEQILRAYDEFLDQVAAAGRR